MGMWLWDEALIRRSSISPSLFPAFVFEQERDGVFKFAHGFTAGLILVSSTVVVTVAGGWT